MTRDEMVNLTQYISVLCPAQKLEKLTPLAWHDVLGHLEFSECRQAAAQIAARQPFIAPSEIIREIADSRCAMMRQSNACRDGDCEACRVSWCAHSCHPGAVDAIAGPPPTPRPTRPQLRGGQPRQLGTGDLPGRY